MKDKRVLEDKLQLICEDAFQALKNLQAAGEQFDVVIIDPLAFIKKRKDMKADLKAYFHLNLLARGHQAVDHPIHLSIPETEYLKTLFVFKS